MADPKFYAINKPHKDGYSPANDFEIVGYEEYAKDPEAFVAKAKRQWTNLREIFNQLGAKTVVMEPDPKNPNQVFTADPSLSFKTEQGKLVTIFSRFSNENRQPEVDGQSAFFEAEGSHVLINAHFRTEGTGDNVYDVFRDVFWSGYTNTPGREGAASGRSDQRAHKALSQVTGVEVISLEVRKPFFHIDTSLAPLPSGHMLCYRGGMSDAAFEKMQQNAFDRYGLSRSEYLIEVSESDAARYACNLRCVGSTIVLPECSQGLQDKLAGIGYKVIATDMSQFIHAGGAIHCVTNDINETRIPGGLAKKNGFQDKLRP
ncbi:MAG: arginine deiminase-related protein [Pseudomonadota bacterium]